MKVPLKLWYFKYLNQRKLFLLSNVSKECKRGKKTDLNATKLMVPVFV